MALENIYRDKALSLRFHASFMDNDFQMFD